MDTTGEAGYRLWFYNNRNGQLDNDPLDRQVSAAYSEKDGDFRVWCQTMGSESLEVDSHAAKGSYFVEVRVDACMLGIADNFDLHSGTHSQTSSNNYDRFQEVEDMDGIAFICQ